MPASLPVSWWLLAPLAAAAACILGLVLLGKVPLRYNLRNLLVRWKTTAVTAVAFTLVLAPLTVLLGFVKGMNGVMESSGRPGNVLILSGGATDEMFGYLAPTDIDRVPWQPQLQPLLARDGDGRPLFSREVYLVVNQPLPWAEIERRLVQLRGIEDPELAARVHGLQLLEGGRWFSPSGVRDDDIEAVLGQGVAREFGDEVQGRPFRVGDRFEVGPRRWVTAGILKSAGTAFDSEIWAKASLVQTFGKKDLYSSMVLCTRDAGTASAAAEILRSWKQSALWALPETEYYHKLAETNRQFMVVIWFITAVMAVGGALSVMNTMFAATSHRTRDVAMLRVLGFARWQVLVSFLLEAVAIGLAGGSLGVALGSLANGWTVDTIVGSVLAGGKPVMLQVVVGADTLAAGLLVTLAIALLGGLLPALSVIRSRPLEAFR
jgi:ABC-type lipoprotein release transport system permease subunit